MSSMENHTHKRKTSKLDHEDTSRTPPAPEPSQRRPTSNRGSEEEREDAAQLNLENSQISNSRRTSPVNSEMDINEEDKNDLPGAAQTVLQDSQITGSQRALINSENMDLRKEDGDGQLGLQPPHLQDDEDDDVSTSPHTSDHEERSASARTPHYVYHSTAIESQLHDVFDPPQTTITRLQHTHNNSTTPESQIMPLSGMSKLNVRPEPRGPESSSPNMRKTFGGSSAYRERAPSISSASSLTPSSFSYSPHSIRHGEQPAKQDQDPKYIQLFDERPCEDHLVDHWLDISRHALDATTRESPILSLLQSEKDVEVFRISSDRTLRCPEVLPALCRKNKEALYFIGSQYLREANFIFSGFINNTNGAKELKDFDVFLSNMNWNKTASDGFDKVRNICMPSFSANSASYAQFLMKLPDLRHLIIGICTEEITLSTSKGHTLQQQATTWSTNASLTAAVCQAKKLDEVLLLRIPQSSTKKSSKKSGTLTEDQVPLFFRGVAQHLRQEYQARNTQQAPRMSLYTGMDLHKSQTVPSKEA